MVEEVDFENGRISNYVSNLLEVTYTHCLCVSLLLHCRVISVSTAAVCSALTVTCLSTRQCIHVLVVHRHVRQTADF